MRYALVERAPRARAAHRGDDRLRVDLRPGLVAARRSFGPGDPAGDATADALRILRKVRAAHGIDTSSPANVCISTGHAVVATRVSFDYGWYPPEDDMLETDLPFVSLWYAIGGEYTKRDGTWEMTAGDPPRS